MQDIKFTKFYRSAIASMLTLGAGWGTYLLFQLLMKKEFTGLNIFEVDAHGQAQIYGWIGMMLLGTCYFFMPRYFQKELLFPKLVNVVFATLLIGIIFSVLGLLMKNFPSFTIIGGICSLTAVVIFAIQMLNLFSKVKEKTQAESFAKGALFFLVFATAYAFWHHLALIKAPSNETLLAQVATFQAPLRDLQVHGVGLFMALAMMQWVFFQPKVKSARRAFFLFLFGVLGEIILFSIYRKTKNHFFAAGLIIPWASLLVGSFCIFVKGGIFNKMPSFGKVAVIWLKISFVMLVLLPLYSKISHLAFSHAYYGAIRHAVTVGFLSQMIFIMAPLLLSRFLPITVPIHKKALFLLNFGCFLRVFFQIATDFSLKAYMLIPISGSLELLATGLFGISLLRFLRQKEKRIGLPILYS